MAKSSHSFRRGGARFKPQPRVLILCEDSKSALSYLQDASRHFRSHVVVQIAHCGRTDPLGIVEEAIAQRKDFEVIYCVIDRDDHESFESAMVRSRDFVGKIKVVASYPCYEFWLLLHFRFTRAPVRAAGGQSAGARMLAALRAEPGMQQYAKGSVTSVFEQLLHRLPTAMTHAAQALAGAQVDQEPNPSTELHFLISELERLGLPTSLV
jgi:hypothetical protein